MGMKIDEIIQGLTAMKSVIGVNQLTINEAIETMRKYQMFQDKYIERLKADMVAMLEDLRLDFQEAELAGVLDNKELIFADEVDDLVQQKINALQESEDKEQEHD